MATVGMSLVVNRRIGCELSIITKTSRHGTPLFTGNSPRRTGSPSGSILMTFGMPSTQIDSMRAIGFSLDPS
jgi:hypothetical protein